MLFFLNETRYSNLKPQALILQAVLLWQNGYLPVQKSWHKHSVKKSFK